MTLSSSSALAVVPFSPFGADGGGGGFGVGVVVVVRPLDGGGPTVNSHDGEYFPSWGMCVCVCISVTGSS